MTDFQPEGFLAVPKAGRAPGVLVLHPWWGLNDTMRGFCSKLAGEGFLAFAPDLYHGKLASTIEDAKALMKALDQERAMADIGQAVASLSERASPAHRGLAVIGFSLGAFFALDLSAADPDRIHAVVLFYGTGQADFSLSRAEYLGHFAEADEFEPRPDVDALEQSLRQAGRPVAFYHYPGVGHWFFEQDRQDAYNEAAATLAWERTLAFLRRLLPSE